MAKETGKRAMEAPQMAMEYLEKAKESQEAVRKQSYKAGEATFRPLLRIYSSKALVYSTA